jgi:hypothetical protein
LQQKYKIDTAQPAATSGDTPWHRRLRQACTQLGDSALQLAGFKSTGICDANGQCPWREVMLLNDSGAACAFS